MQQVFTVGIYQSHAAARVAVTSLAGAPSESTGCINESERPLRFAQQEDKMSEMLRLGTALTQQGDVPICVFAG